MKKEKSLKGIIIELLQWAKRTQLHRGILRSRTGAQDLSIGCAEDGSADPPTLVS